VVKRLSDFLLAFIALPFASPFLLLSALLIWLDTPGPILYRSPRVGRRSNLQ
jgi:polysaccharide biosynthesis protein PslA